MKYRFKFSPNLFLSFILVASIAMSIITVVTAATPNPGHPWSETGDGTFAVTGPSTSRTYTFPDANATVLTSNAAVTIAQGGTGQTAAAAAFDGLSPTTTRGDLIYRGVSNNARLAVGGNNTVLRSNGTDPAWGQVNLSTDVSGTLPSGNIGSHSHAAGDVTSGTLVAARGGTGFDGSAAGNGRLAIGNGSGFTLANLTQGTNIAVTNGSGSISLATVNNPTFSTSVTAPILDNSAGLTIAGTNATSLTLARSGLTTAVAGSLTIGGGTAITKYLSVTQANVVSASVGSRVCASYASITVTGAAVGDTAIASPTAVAGGIETVDLNWSAYVSAANTVIIRACNPTNTAINTADTQTWRADVWQH